MSVIAITYPLALPTNRAPTDTDINLDYISVGRRHSPFSGVGQAQDWGGRLWRARVTVPPMLRAEADEWLVWFSKLRGTRGTFLLGDWDRRTPRGSPGSPLVNGAGQTGNGLIVDGMGAGGTLIAGDHVQLENRLYRVVANATADGSGNATLQIEPDLRSAPADNAPLTTSSPKGLFALTSNYMPSPSDFNGVHRFSFEALEAL